MKITENPGLLAGHYGGATASVTLGLGAGGNILVGGMDGSISLQPISIAGNTGLNVAAGLATINLNFETIVGSNALAFYRMLIRGRERDQISAAANSGGGTTDSA